MTKAGKDKYEDFYERAFDTLDIDTIYAEGGSISIKNFFEAAKNNIKDQEYAKALNYRVTKKGETAATLGGLLWNRYFKDENVTQNSVNRIIVKSGTKIEFQNKTYKGGQFLPKIYFSKKRY